MPSHKVLESDEGVAGSFPFPHSHLGTTWRWERELPVAQGFRVPKSTRSRRLCDFQEL